VSVTRKVKSRVAMSAVNDKLESIGQALQAFSQAWMELTGWRSSVSEAVVRQEHYLFPLIKILMQKGIVSYEEIEEASQGMLPEVSLAEYWGVDPVGSSTSPEVEEETAE
jgi:hypothetical protein